MLNFISDELALKLCNRLRLAVKTGSAEKFRRENIGSLIGATFRLAARMIPNPLPRAAGVQPPQRVREVPLERVCPPVGHSQLRRAWADTRSLRSRAPSRALPGVQQRPSDCRVDALAVCDAGAQCGVPRNADCSL